MIDDGAIAKEFDEFIEVMVEASPSPAELESGDITPAELREQNLIGSTAILRAFVAAWFELKRLERGAEQTGEAFASFAPHMTPVFADPRDSLGPPSASSRAMRTGRCTPRHGPRTQRP